MNLLGRGLHGSKEYVPARTALRLRTASIHSGMNVGISRVGQGVVLLSVAAVVVAAAASWMVRGGGQQGLARIYTMNADGSGLELLLGDSIHEYWGPAFSPDGQWLVVSVYRRGEEGVLWLRSVEGSEWRELTPGYLPVWSPDSAHIVFLSQDGFDERTSELFKIAVDGSGRTRLTSNDAQEYGASWSPDGTRIAYGSKQDGTWQIYTMKADGSDSRQLETGGGTAPAWSPDGKSIAFNSDRDGRDDLYLLDLATGAVRQLTDSNDRFDGNAAWSPDGTRLAFRSGCCFRDDDIVVINADGSGWVNLTSSSDVAELIPSWSPDGARIMFHAWRYGDGQ